jgi:hypothetical protein
MQLSKITLEYCGFGASYDETLFYYEGDNIVRAKQNINFFKTQNTYYDYDELGRVIRSETEYYSDPDKVEIKEFEYSGDTIEVTKYNKSNPDYDIVTRHIYDNGNLVSSQIISNYNHKPRQYAYDDMPSFLTGTRITFKSDRFGCFGSVFLSLLFCKRGHNLLSMGCDFQILVQILVQSLSKTPFE